MKIKRTLAIFICCALIVTCSSAFAAADSLVEKVDVQVDAVIQEYFTTYMDALVAKEYPDFTSITVNNANTDLYSAMTNYEVDSAILFEAGFAEYTYSLSYDDYELKNNHASVGLIMSANIRFERAPADTITERNIAYAFELTNVNGEWRISNINSSHIVFVQFIESLQENSTTSKDFSTVQVNREINNRLASMKRLGNEARYGVMSPESQKKLADVEAIELSMSLQESSIEAVSADTSVSFNKTNAISYANTYANEGSSSTKRLFYYISKDCTNYLSQCVWAGYGGYDSSNLTQSKTNITNKYRMVNNTSADWYAKGWFGHTNGGSGPWEQVKTHWTFVLDSTKSYGPAEDV